MLCCVCVQKNWEDGVTSDPMYVRTGTIYLLLSTTYGAFDVQSQRYSTVPYTVGKVVYVSRKYIASTQKWHTGGDIRQAGRPDTSLWWQLFFSIEVQ